MTYTKFSRHACLTPLIIALFVWSPPLAAQSMGAKGEDFLYRVIQHDTLFDLAKTFAHDERVWPTLQSINQVDDPYRLPIGKVLRIPFRLIPEIPAQAVARHTLGAVTVNGRALQIGDQLSEDDTIQTGPDGSATLQLIDGSLLSISPDSSLTLQRLRAFKGTGLTDSMIDMKNGSLESEVAPQKTGVGRFEVRTPVTVTGVRGTNLRVHATPQGTRHEVVHGQAAVDGTHASEVEVEAGQGVRVNDQGERTSVRPLLPAPELGAPVRDSTGWVMDFPAVQGAQSYLVRVTTDRQGAFVLSGKTFSAPPAHFSTHGSGMRYVFVRAIDDVGLAGLDAYRDLEGHAVLQTSEGRPVLSGFGEPVTLASD